MALLQDYLANIEKQEPEQIYSNSKKTKISHIGRSGHTIDVYTENEFYLASFNGIKVACKMLHLYDETLRKRLLDGQLYKGFLFKYRNGNPTVISNPEKNRK